MRGASCDFFFFWGSLTAGILLTLAYNYLWLEELNDPLGGQPLLAQVFNFYKSNPILLVKGLELSTTPTKYVGGASCDLIVKITRNIDTLNVL